MTQFEWSSTGIEVVKAFQSTVNHKTIVITGASAGGLGAETALCLAHGNPHHILLAGRSADKIKAVIEETKMISPASKITFIQIDLASQASVRRAAAAINTIVEKVDILINNAAIMACPYAKTEDGIESQFATNYIGHFLLTNLLMEKIRAAGKGARIINLTSDANVAEELNLNEINFNDGMTYNPIAAYIQSKVAILLFTVSLSRKFDHKEISSFSVHPGRIITGLQKHFEDPSVSKKIMQYIEAKSGGKFRREEKKTLQQGCSTTLVAALDPSITAFSGLYLADADIGKEQPKPSVMDPDTAEKLWAMTEKLVAQRFYH